MANCGIKKYDELPSRVEWIDVDYLRYKLFTNLKEHEKLLEKLEKARIKFRQKKLK